MPWIIAYAKDRVGPALESEDVTSTKMETIAVAFSVYQLHLAFSLLLLITRLAIS